MYGCIVRLLQSMIDYYPARTPRYGVWNVAKPVYKWMQRLFGEKTCPGSCTVDSISPYAYVLRNKNTVYPPVFKSALRDCTWVHSSSHIKTRFENVGNVNHERLSCCLSHDRAVLLQHALVPHANASTFYTVPCLVKCISTV